MIGLIGKKLGMTAVYVGGNQVPCTVVHVGPCVVTQVKTRETDGYDAVQLAYGDKPKHRVSKSLQGHFAKAETTPKQEVIEFRDFSAEAALGKEFRVEDIFSTGEYVDASARSKGKGFQGVVKRHNFAGVGQATHGQHNRLRAPGSIGGCSYPGRVFKGMRMAGRTGGRRITVGNLQVVDILPEENVLLLKGAVPGRRGAYVVVQK